MQFAAAVVDLDPNGLGGRSMLLKMARCECKLSVAIYFDLVLAVAVFHREAGNAVQAL